MSSPSIFFAPLRIPVVDTTTGLMRREWYLFFQALFDRVGGAIAPTPDDLLQGAPPVVPTPTFDDLLAELRAVREQVAVLSSQLNDIQQGTQL